MLVKSTLPPAYMVFVVGESDIDSPDIVVVLVEVEVEVLVDVVVLEEVVEDVVVEVVVDVVVELVTTYVSVLDTVSGNAIELSATKRLAVKVP